MNSWHNDLRRETLALLRYNISDINFGRTKFKHRIDKLACASNLITLVT